MKFRFRWLLLLPVVLAALPALSLAELPPGFPSTGLEDRIAFWEKIFTVYGADDYVLHDNFRVNLIYEIATEKTQRARVRAVRNTLTEVGRKISAPETMGVEARRIYDRIAETDVKLTAGNIAVLRQRVHAQRGIKERFRDGVIRSGRYLQYFERVFEEVGVPTVITLLPLVESSYENRAYSSAGAAGIWQFTRSTGRLLHASGPRSGRPSESGDCNARCRTAAQEQLRRVEILATGNLRVQPRSSRYASREETTRLGPADNHP